MSYIGDNVYIEDTLITCAEYQLFIDEMRAQGKYFHPDHWKSFQFPIGQAQMPIRGVRFSDALAFCEWLTHRENNDWQYRLPTLEEARKEPLLLEESYWIIYSDNTPQIIPSTDPTFFSEKKNIHNISVKFSKTIANSKSFVETVFDVDSSISKVVNIDDIEMAFSNMVPQKEPQKYWYSIESSTPQEYPYYNYYKYLPTKEYIIQAFNHAYDVASGLHHLVVRDVSFNYYLEADISSFSRLSDILIIYIFSYLDDFTKNNKQVIFYDDDQFFGDYEHNDYASDIRGLLYEAKGLLIKSSQALDVVKACIKRFSFEASYKDGYSIINEIENIYTYIKEIKSNLANAKNRAGLAGTPDYWKVDLTTEVHYIEGIIDLILSLNDMTLIIIFLELRRTNLYPADESIRIVKELKV